jgi:aspartyl-tRNA(Asn)/glutamyl-tRNA(Gln) amidotransferase subunit B
LKDCIENDKDISDTVEDFEKEANENSGNLEEIIKDILDKNPQAVDDFKNGKQASIGFLIGQVMQATKGSANPNDVRTTLLKELE